MSDGTSEATRLLRAMGGGDSRAASALLPLIYDELRRLARAKMSQERAGHTLQATALVHEGYLRLMDDAAQQWDGRRHFFAAAAEAMRRILIEHARAKNADKRGGGMERVGLDDDELQRPGRGVPGQGRADQTALLRGPEPGRRWREIILLRRRRAASRPAGHALAKWLASGRKMRFSADICAARTYHVSAAAPVTSRRGRVTVLCICLASLPKLLPVLAGHVDREL
jgi:DNA-directed RNA polymerase specialized sigma24 family protein